MSATERVVQSILYELGCVLIGCLVMQFVPHEGQPLVLMIIFSLLAMVWNFVFNWIFDKLVPSDRLARGPVIRTIHAVLFEGLFMLATVPIIMYMMHMSFWMLGGNLPLPLAFSSFTMSGRSWETRPRMCSVLRDSKLCPYTVWQTAT